MVCHPRLWPFPLSRRDEGHRGLAARALVAERAGFRIELRRTDEVAIVRVVLRESDARGHFFAVARHLEQSGREGRVPRRALAVAVQAREVQARSLIVVLAGGPEAPRCEERIARPADALDPGRREVGASAHVAAAAGAGEESDGPLRIDRDADAPI